MVDTTLMGSDIGSDLLDHSLCIVDRFSVTVNVTFVDSI
jgi:hypothetical protein